MWKGFFPTVDDATAVAVVAACLWQPQPLSTVRMAARGSLAHWAACCCLVEAPCLREVALALRPSAAAMFALSSDCRAVLLWRTSRDGLLSCLCVFYTFVIFLRCNITEQRAGSNSLASADAGGRGDSHGCHCPALEVLWPMLPESLARSLASCPNLKPEFLFYPQDKRHSADPWSCLLHPAHT